MAKRAIVRFSCLLVVLGVLAASGATLTAGSSRTTYFTFSAPVRLPGVVLAPGTYVFDRMSAVEPTLIRVMNRKTSKLHLIAFTRLVHRPADRNLDPTIALGEAMKGAPRPITVWFPRGETLGHQFIYE
jgi:hypothetical protein